MRTISKKSKKRILTEKPSKPNLNMKVIVSMSITIKIKGSRGKARTPLLSNSKNFLNEFQNRNRKLNKLNQNHHKNTLLQSHRFWRKWMEIIWIRKHRFIQTKQPIIKTAIRSWGRICQCLSPFPNKPWIKKQTPHLQKKITRYASKVQKNQSKYKSKIALQALSTWGSNHWKFPSPPFIKWATKLINSSMLGKGWNRSLCMGTLAVRKSHIWKKRTKSRNPKWRAPSNGITGRWKWVSTFNRRESNWRGASIFEFCLSIHQSWPILFYEYLFILMSGSI